MITSPLLPGWGQELTACPVLPLEHTTFLCLLEFCGEFFLIKSLPSC